MTNDELQAIEDRLSRATPGPWTGSLCGEEVYAHGDVEAIVADLCGTIGNDKQHEYNTEFIAHAPTDIAALIKALKEARAKIDGLETRLLESYRKTLEVRGILVEARGTIKRLEIKAREEAE